MNIFKISFFSMVILIVVMICSCKNRKGKYLEIITEIDTASLHQSNNTGTKKMSEIIPLIKDVTAKKLSNVLGVNPDDLEITENANGLTLKIWNADDYAIDAEKLRYILQADDKVEIWATYLLKEAAPSFAATDTTDKELSYGVTLSGLLNMQMLNNKTCMEEPYAGYASEKDTAMIDGILMKNLNLFPADIKFAWAYKPNADKLYPLILLKKSTDENNSLLSDNFIKSAKAAASDNSGYWNVYFTMNDEGIAQWANITENHIGKPLAIVFNNYVYSVPAVMEKITDGSCGISNCLNQKEASETAGLLNAGTLPAPMHIISENVKEQ